MQDTTITRRGFLATAAGAAVATAAVGASRSAWDQAFGVNYHSDEDVREVHSTCYGCGANCGFTAYVNKGKLGKVIGDAENPSAAGKLCAIGYAYPRVAEGEDRLVEPLKRNAQGGFDPITWDQAFSEIAARVGSMQPQELAFIGDGRPTSSFYGKRLMWALGSANVYTDDAAHSLSRKAGTYAAIGAEGYTPDVEHSQMTLLVCDGALDGMRPAHIAALETARQNGAHIVMVGPVQSGDTRFASEWLGIKPGSQLALVLALSAELLRDGYDKAFVDAQGAGFDEYRAAVSSYGAKWAEGVTGLPEDSIERLAAELRNAAPACSVSLGLREGNGALYGNSGELARATALLNALLGCYNQKGGALVDVCVRPGELDGIEAVAAPNAQRVGDTDYPLAAQVGGSSAVALKAAHEGALHGVIFCETDYAADASSPSYVRSAIEGCDLSVYVGTELCETAQACQYVLPDVSYLERADLPSFVDGPVPSVVTHSAAIDVLHAGTKPLDEIFGGLAKACGVGDAFDFSLEDVARAQLESVGVSYDGAVSVGTVSLAEDAVTYGELPVWGTPSGKIEFASDTCRAAGLSASPMWVEPTHVLADGQLALASGALPVNAGGLAADDDAIAMLISKYDLSRVWLNEADAKRLGIADGDTVTLANQSDLTARVRVTNRVVPGAVFVPEGFGRTSSGEAHAKGVGVNVADLVPFAVEAAYGSGMVRDAVLTVQKAGA